MSPELKRVLQQWMEDAESENASQLVRCAGLLPYVLQNGTSYAYFELRGILTSDFGSSSLTAFGGGGCTRYALAK